MNDSMKAGSKPAATIPDDDPKRNLTVAGLDDKKTPHLSIAGGTYSILLGAEDTSGRYCLIEMLVPPGGGPPPHRHDFEEMFTLLQGELEFTFRGVKSTARAGETVNIPANAPHFFRNVSTSQARMLCFCSPAGQEKYFMEVGDPVESRTSPPPQLSDEEKAARGAKARALAAKYKTEFLTP